MKPDTWFTNGYPDPDKYDRLVARWQRYMRALDKRTWANEYKALMGRYDEMKGWPKRYPPEV